MEPLLYTDYLKPALDAINTITGREFVLTYTPAHDEETCDMNWREASLDRHRFALGHIGNLEVSFTHIEEDGDYTHTTRIKFCLKQLPGCCGVLVSFHTHIAPDMQNKGIGTLLMKLKLDIAKHFGYTMLLLTDIVRDAPEHAILAKYGFKRVMTFDNLRTTNNVGIYMVQVEGVSAKYEAADVVAPPKPVDAEDAA